MSGGTEFPYRYQISLRWNDHDTYGHVNNVEYYSFFDTAINEFLIKQGGLNIRDGDRIGLCAESHCSFKSEITFPGTVSAGLRATHIGNSSVRYEIALSDEASGTLVAQGWFVHVFVDRATRRPAGIPPAVRAALETIA